MGIFDKLFRRRPNETGQSDSQNLEYEKRLEEDFSLKFIGNRWRYEGIYNDYSDYAAVFSEPENCILFLRKLQQFNLVFDKICIVGENLPFIVCNSKPPVAIETSLDFKGTIELIGKIQDRGKPIHMYHGTCLLSLQ